MNPSCTCTFCTVNYHCPNCARKPLVHAKCRLEAEIKAKKDAELRAIAKIERDRLERGQADELAGAMNEFFTALYTQNSDAYPGGPDASSYLASSFSGEQPLPSPDSITVTTEFGVLEETGNVTIISAGPHLHAYDDAAEDDDEEEEEEEGEEDAGFHSSLPYHPHHIHNSLDQEVVMTEDTSSLLPTPAGSSDWVTAVALQHQQQQNTWLLQQQMQNMYSVAVGTHASQQPTHFTAPVVAHHEGLVDQLDGGESDILGETEDEDEGDEADVDTDEVFEDEGDEDEDALIDDAATPTPPTISTFQAT